MNPALPLLALTAIGYLTAGVGIQRGIYLKSQKSFPQWRKVLWLTFALHTIALLLYSGISGNFYINSLKETFAPLAWFVMLLYLLLGERWSVEVTGAVAAPAAFAMTAFSVFALWQGHGTTAAGPGLYIHVVSLILGFSSFALATFCAILYFVQAKLLKEKQLDGIFRALPPLGTLDQVASRLIWAGFPALVIGIASGLFIQGGHWSWGTQEVVVVATSLFYTIYLHARVAGWQGKRLNSILLIASLFAIASFLLPGGHQ
jgi:ABC-type transport system involved in cytochrome c biogenesis permease subunit